MPRYFETGSLILQDVLFRAGERTDLTGPLVSDYLDIAKSFVQRAYHDILSAAPWPWGLTDPPGVLSLVAKVTGTCDVTLGSTSVTLSAVLAPSMVGRWLEIDNEQIPYRISAHTSGTTAVTLDAAYTGSTATGVSYTIYKDEYTLSTDCLRIWRAWNRNDPSQVVDIVTESELQERFPNRIRGTYPTIACLIRGSKLRISPWPETQPITIEYEYTAKPIVDLTFDGVTATDTPLVPIVDRQIISDSALVMLYNNKNDGRAADVAQLVGTKIGMMMNIYLPIGKVRFYVKKGQGLW